MRYLFSVWLVLIPAIALAADPVADLKAGLKNGQIKLEYESNRGYLNSLLKTLNVPVSSQTLVFSKTSLQSERISPETPRAIYFNDDVYVAWVQGASGIEIMSVDPKRGALFYILSQENDGNPDFEQVGGHICSVCHYVQDMKKFVPLLMMSSVIPDKTGNADGTFPIPVDDRSPLEERWGGWYVTGSHGSQRHLGNLVLETPRTPLGNLSGIDVSKSVNLMDLSKRFNTSKYLSPHSDIAALMVLGHQIEVQNLITRASADVDSDVQTRAEPLVKAMLFADAVPLKEPVKGTSNFSAEFPKLGWHDNQGRSLRELDLKTRLFRYPLSYMIYSKSFDEMPDTVKAYVYQRLKEVLTGQDKSRDFSHISAADRTAILEILRDTKPDFRP